VVVADQAADVDPVAGADQADPVAGADQADPAENGVRDGQDVKKKTQGLLNVL
jgi:hypothetical protein